jgi:hypothetical protein
MGNTDMEDSLGKLDKLTQEEAWMTLAESLKQIHSVDGKVVALNDNIVGVNDSVNAVEGKVEDMRNDVQGMVQDFGSDVKGISSGIQDVGDKLDRVDGS